MKHFWTFIISLFCFSIGVSQGKSIHSYKVKSISGGEINFSQFKGKKILIVNTASQCGLTNQYKDLEDLYQKYKKQLVVVGFPADNFANQEPGNNEEISNFCKQNYGVSFPMAAKISVKGKNQAKIYQFLTTKKLNGITNIDILWNFHKILLDENGIIIDSFIPKTKPMSKKITKHFSTP